MVEVYRNIQQLPIASSIPHHSRHRDIGVIPKEFMAATVHARLSESSFRAKIGLWAGYRARREFGEFRVGVDAQPLTAVMATTECKDLERRLIVLESSDTITGVIC